MAVAQANTNDFLVTSQLDGDTHDLRLATACLGVLPAVLIVGAALWQNKGKGGNDYLGNKGESSMAYKWVMKILFIGLWSFVCVVAGFYMNPAWVAGFIAIHVSTSIMASSWMPYGGKDSTKSDSYVSGSLLLHALIMGSLLLIAPLDNPPEGDVERIPEARMAMMTCWAPVVAWIFYTWGGALIKKQSE